MAGRRHQERRPRLGPAKWRRSGRGGGRSSGYDRTDHRGPGGADCHRRRRSHHPALGRRHRQGDPAITAWPLGPLHRLFARRTAAGFVQPGRHRPPLGYANWRRFTSCRDTASSAVIGRSASERAAADCSPGAMISTFGSGTSRRASASPNTPCGRPVSRKMLTRRPRSGNVA